MYGGHKHRWVYVHAGVVGCDLCGLVHVCEVGTRNVMPCELQYTDEGSCVCALTALELQCSMFMDEHLDVETYNRNRSATYAMGSSGADRTTKNFQENVQVQHAAAGMRACTSVCFCVCLCASGCVGVCDRNGWPAQTINETVHGVVHLLLFSKTAEASRRDELQRYRAKTDTALAHFDHMNRGRTQHADLVLALEYVMTSTRLSRIPAVCAVLPREAHLRTLCRWLTVIVQELRIVSMSALRVSPERIKHFAVGMLYVFTHGLAARGRTLVPAHLELKALLPLQAALGDQFGFHPKIITESENTIKRIINEMSANDFERFANRLAHLRAPVCPYSPGRGGCVCLDDE